MKEHIIQIDQLACIGCGACVRDCPAYNIEINGNHAVLCSQSCIKCGHCVAICPKNAVSMSGFIEEPVPIDHSVHLDAKQLLAALKTRRTIRQFKQAAISQQILDEIIEAGRCTPTAKNAQDVSYIILNKNLAKYEQTAVALFRRLLPWMKLFDASARRARVDDHFFFKHAPLVILVISKNKINAALAASHMELMAQAHGLGVLYSGFFAMAVKYSRRLRKQLGLRCKEHVVTALVIGESDVRYHRTVPKEQADIRVL